MDAAVRRRLRVILGGLNGSQGASVAASAASETQANPDPATTAKIASLESSIASLQSEIASLKVEADAVTLKTVFRDKDGLITHVVETTVTPDELEQALNARNP